jgi:hydrogenase nickel incorporation protein HypA/HybF
MHELGITRNIVAIVEDAARGRRVRRVDVDIGKLSGVLAEAVAFCFEAVAQGTAVEGATLAIRELEGRGRCRACGRELETPTLFTACACGGREIERLQGEELKVRSMEIEEAA